MSAKSANVSIVCSPNRHVTCWALTYASRKNAKPNLMKIVEVSLFSSSFLIVVGKQATLAVAGGSDQPMRMVIVPPNAQPEVAPAPQIAPVLQKAADENEEADLEELDEELAKELGLLEPVFEKSTEESITVGVNVEGGSMLSMEAILRCVY